MRFPLLFLAFFAASPAFAQHSHSEGGHTMENPQEAGQSGFAALTEIVAILREDPETDWSTVDIAALRRHLVDMDLLTTQARVDAIARPDGARFEVRGSERVLEAIHAMVPAHAPFLAAETGWDVSVEVLQDSVALIVDGDAAQIQGLGFFGMMTIGGHHQEHHLMLARGAPPHR
jgi:hypothetical protein